MNADTKIVVDASPVGVAAMLIQVQNKGEHKVIVYASRRLSETESRCSQIERECLAVYFGCVRFQMYVLGKPFVVCSDNKPLMHIFNNVMKTAPFRVERMWLRLQGFRFKVEYISGNQNHADYASRHPLPLDKSENSQISDELTAQVHRLVIDTCKPATIESIREATEGDDLLKNVMKLLSDNKVPPQARIPSPFRKVWNELSVEDGLLLREERIIIPNRLQKGFIKFAHEGHLGVANTKRLLRSKYWFPKMDKMVEDKVKYCESCQAAVYKNDTEPLRMSELPNGPWESIKVDFYGPVPSGL